MCNSHKKWDNLINLMLLDIYIESQLVPFKIYVIRSQKPVPQYILNALANRAGCSIQILKQLLIFQGLFGVQNTQKIHPIGFIQPNIPGF